MNDIYETYMRHIYDMYVVGYILVYLPEIIVCKFALEDVKP